MTARIRLWQVDAFASRPFAGNPAAVCPLDRWLPADTMQAIAAENNLSETAFFVRRSDGEFDLRWFTPKTEVDLCGHATLASGAVLMQELEPSRRRVVFHTKSGPLIVERRGDRFAIDLPARPARPVAIPDLLVEALGARPSAALRARDLLAVFDRAEQVRGLTPDLAAVARLEDTFAVCVTAPGTGIDDDVDFVSRFFAPAKGVPEDPVTGSAHSTLVPFWAARLGKRELRARQVSARGGELECTLEGERVSLGGQAVIVLAGELRF
jgi:predicted PhzF superfamily epimerase YddE/YHI9